MRVIAEQLGANVTESELHTAHRLDELVALDSIAILEFVVGLEQEFDMIFDQASLEHSFLTDIPSLVKYLDARAGGGRQ